MVMFHVSTLLCQESPTHSCWVRLLDRRHWELRHSWRPGVGLRCPRQSGPQNGLASVRLCKILWDSVKFCEILGDSVDFRELPSINPSFSWYKQYIPGKSLFSLHLVWGNIVRWQVEHLVFDYQNARGSDHIARTNFGLCSIKTLVSCYSPKKRCWKGSNYHYLGIS